MNMIFHFNTQEDALNSIELAADMKRDSTSMTSIALLTMVFLPGTFVAVRTLYHFLKILTHKQLERTQRRHLPINT